MNIYETSEFEPIAVLFKESGLEVKPEVKPDGIVKMWRCDDNEGNLIGGATAQVLDGIYVVKHIAVKEGLRGTGIGTRLLGLVEGELIERGAKEMWLSGKVPEYYLRFGWEIVSVEEAPPFSKCLICQQFNTSCFPSIMRKKV